MTTIKCPNCGTIGILGKEFSGYEKLGGQYGQLKCDKCGKWLVGEPTPIGEMVTKGVGAVLGGATVDPDSIAGGPIDMQALSEEIARNNARSRAIVETTIAALPESTKDELTAIMERANENRAQAKRAKWAALWSPFAVLVFFSFLTKMTDSSSIAGSGCLFFVLAPVVCLVLSTMAKSRAQKEEQRFKALSGLQLKR